MISTLAGAEQVGQVVSRASRRRKKKDSRRRKKKDGGKNKFLLNLERSSVENSIGVSLKFNGLYNFSKIVFENLLSTPHITLSGLIKSSIADPSLKNSGFEATSKCLFNCSSFL